MVTEPESMDDLIYFTKRTIGKGKATAWVYKGDCRKCGKTKMSKPTDEKTGKVKIRSKEYICSACGNTEEKVAHEETLTAEIKYTCPKCSHEGDAEIPYKRKNVKIWDEEAKKDKAAKALVLNCEKCNENIYVTKKMK